MDINDFAKMMGDGCYVLLAMNFFWGLYHLIVGGRRVRQLRFRNHVEQDEFLDEVSQLIKEEKYEAVEELCADDPRALPELIHVAVSNRDLGYDNMRQVVTEVMQRDIMSDLEYRTSWVATVIKAGPLLGLFGTVLGMLAAFGRIGTGEKVESHEIAGEISIALICTAMGLVTAIPFNFMLMSLTAKIRTFQDSLGAGLVRVLEYLRKAI